MRRRRPAAIPARVAAAFAAAVAILALGPLVLDVYTLNLFTLAYLMIAGALAWNWMGGFVGQVSFGHAAMFGIGGFVAARLVLVLRPGGLFGQKVLG